MTADANDVTKTEDCAAEVADVGQAVAPPLAPALDLAHLSRMTLGESALEREVLTLFDRQAGMLLARMASEEPRVVAALAHTLAGSASGIGAWKVAAAAAAIERAACEPDAVALTRRMDDLAAAVAEVHAAIAEFRRSD
jgi:HPt (histidine-containing phosphotransfer) domain-containing protein